MWFVVGWILGGSRDGRRLSRVLTVMGAWIIMPWLASTVALNAVHAAWAGYAAGFSTMAAMLAFASMPRPGPTRLALLEGLTLWCSLALIVAVVRVAFHAIGAGFVAALAGEPKWIGIGLAAVALAGVARWRIDAAMEGETA